MLEVRDVTKRYGALTAVRNISFAVGPGEVLGYLGPNGSGKSTTVKMLAGLMPPTLGTILFDGADIQTDLIGYKTHVGYVPEEANVYTYLTAPEHLRLCGRLRGISAAALEEKIDRPTGPRFWSSAWPSPQWLCATHLQGTRSCRLTTMSTPSPAFSA